jgi:hypothetical protein
MLYREMEEEEYMNMENENMLPPEQTPMYEYPMMQQQMYQNPMMQYQMDQQWMPQMHHLGCPMMSGMYNPSTYSPQVGMEEHELDEDFPENMERAPHYSNATNHYDYYYNYNHYDNYDHDHNHNHNHGYYPYNPFYQNYYPFYNFNPLLIPLLFGRD